MTAGRFDVDRSRLAALLRRHEGESLKPYRDTKQILTIGVGHNLSRGITIAASEFILQEDIEAAVRDVERAYPWAVVLDDVRRRVLVELMFNLGARKLAEFVKMLHAMAIGDYQTAAQELLDSQWKTDVGPYRSGRLALMLETGTDQVGD